MPSQNLEFRVPKTITSDSEAHAWRTFIPEFARDEQGTLFMRRQGGDAVYRLTPSVKKGVPDVYRCDDCRDPIKIVMVAHPIDYGLLSRKRGNLYEDVPYCQKCDDRPSSQGDPVSPEVSLFPDPLF